MKKNKETNWSEVFESQEAFNKEFPHIFEEKWYEKYTDFFRYTIPFAYHDFTFEVKMKWQMLTRGHNDRQVWNFCGQMADLNAKLLTQLRDNGCGYPGDLTEKKWKKILTQMIEGFEAFDEYKYTDDKKAEKKYKLGMELYAKYFPNLWD